MNVLKVRLSILSSLMALAAVTFVCFAETALAQQRIRITEGQVAPTPIAIAEFTDLGGEISDAGREIAEIISNDLLSSGLFDPIDSAAFIAPPKSPAIRPNFANWAPLGAKGLLVGSAEIDADGKLQVEFVLWDVITQRDITSGSAMPSPDGLRQLAHKISDFVYEEFTGDSGYFDTQIVYVAESGTQSRRVKRLAIMDQDGHNHRYLTSGLDLVLTPDFRPGRMKLHISIISMMNPTSIFMTLGLDEANGLAPFRDDFCAPFWTARRQADNELGTKWPD